MNKTLSLLGLLCALVAFGVTGAETSDVIYWNTPEAVTLQQRIPATADVWQLIPQLTTQKTRTYCGIASAVTVLNAMGIERAGDPVYFPYPYVTQDSFFTPSVLQHITPLTVSTRGISMKELEAALQAHGITVVPIAGDSLDIDQLRERLSQDLVDKDHYLLANYHRPTLNQRGGGHWSVLGAYDPAADRVLILDVARYAYPPAWVDLATLYTAINTIDPGSNAPRGLLILSVPLSAPDTLNKR